MILKILTNENIRDVDKN